MAGYRINAFRYATLMKYKGNNFPEDSGGVWGFDEEEYAMEIEEFQADEVQAALGKWKFPVHVQVERQLSYDDDIEDMDSELPEELLEFANVLKEATKIYEESNDLEKTLQFLKKHRLEKNSFRKFGRHCNRKYRRREKKNLVWKRSAGSGRIFVRSFMRGQKRNSWSFNLMVMQTRLIRFPAVW